MKKIKLTILLLFTIVSLFSKEGIASFYHDKYHGKMTSNGEIYNRDSLTCAHRTLPFGTKLIVTNLDNDKSIKVTVNDRGPFIKGREIDLSYAAADSLNFIEKGLQRVKFEIIK